MIFSGVLYGEACTGGGVGDCTETVNIVCDTTCKCTTDSFRKGDTECATSKSQFYLICVVGNQLSHWYVSLVVYVVPFNYVNSNINT